jgi:ABC-type Fe3+-hydroxamate transport system substrate-binding protein
METVMSDRVKTLEQKVEVLEELLEYYERQLDRVSASLSENSERLNYVVAMLNDWGTMSPHSEVVVYDKNA